MTLPSAGMAVDLDTISNQLATEGVQYKDPNEDKLFLGIGVMHNDRENLANLANLRLQVEMIMLPRYFLLCDNMVADIHYGASGATAITAEKDQWKVCSTNLR